MTSKEFTALGKALKALVEVGAMEQVKEIIDYMASEKPFTKEQETDTHE